MSEIKQKNKYKFPLKIDFPVTYFYHIECVHIFASLFVMKKKFFAYICAQIDREKRMVRGKTRFVECSSFAGFHGSKSYT